MQKEIEVKGSSIQETKFLTFMNKYPNLFEDVSMMKVIFLPSELLVLKYLFAVSRPITIREMYRQTNLATFCALFKNPDYMDLSFLIPQLNGEGYGVHYFSESEIKEAKKEVIEKTKNSADEISLAEAFYEALQKRGVKVISYDKLQNVFKRLEEWGLIMRRTEGSTNKGIFFTLNPLFYNKFKNKIQEIKRL